MNTYETPHLQTPGTLSDVLSEICPFGSAQDDGMFFFFFCSFCF